MKPVSVILVGAKGKMGREIAAVLAEHKKTHLFGEVNRGLAEEYRKIAEQTNLKNGVVIDFSLPKGMRQALSWCVKNKIPFVSGTTGISSADKKALAQAGKKIPVLWAPNMSIGMQLYIRMLKAVAKDLGLFELQVEETHHKRKKDAPSGTAKWIQESLEKSSGRKLPKVLSIRGGGVFGIHTTHILGEDETITVTHTALNRRLFARGAVEAAVWLRRQRPGLYELADIFNG